MSMQPETREELYLAALAGEGEAPAPLTRRERYLKKIVEKTGGSGASVQPDHAQNDPAAADYIKNRTHWIDESDTFTFNGVFSPDAPAIENTNNGTAYMVSEVVPTYDDLANFGTVKVDGYTEDLNSGYVSDWTERGYIIIYDGCCYVVYDSDVSGVPCGIYAAPSWHFESLTIKGKALFKTYHTLDPAYLPEGVPYVEESEEVIAEFDTTDDPYGSSWGGDFYAIWAQYNSNPVVVYADGVRYDGTWSNETLNFGSYSIQHSVGNYSTSYSGVIKIAIVVDVYHPLAPSLGGVPTPTSEDEGKVLTVSGGAPAWGAGVAPDIIVDYTNKDALDSASTATIIKSITFAEAKEKILNGNVLVALCRNSRWEENSETGAVEVYYAGHGEIRGWALDPDQTRNEGETDAYTGVRIRGIGSVGGSFYYTVDIWDDDTIEYGVGV